MLSALDLAPGRQQERDAAGSKYDDLVKSGAPVYAVFVRLKGPGPGPQGTNQVLSRGGFSFFKGAQPINKSPPSAFLNPPLSPK